MPGAAAKGRFLPVAILSPDRLFLGERSLSSVSLAARFLNDGFRLLAALQLFEKLSPRSAATGQVQTFAEFGRCHLNVRFPDVFMTPSAA